jgi:hypothetical protein
MLFVCLHLGRKILCASTLASAAWQCGFNSLHQFTPNTYLRVLTPHVVLSFFRHEILTYEQEHYRQGVVDPIVFDDAHPAIM